MTNLYNVESVEATRLAISQSWRRSLITVCCFLLLLALFYWPTVIAIVSQWRTVTFSHGFLVIPISVYLAWLRRNRLASLNPDPTFWALPLLAVFAVGWLLGQLTTTAVLQQFCLVAMVIVLLWGILGTIVARALLMPLMFLLFAVPLGTGLIPKLQDFAAWFAVKMLDFSSVPVLLEGRFISVPSGRWEVAESCSGIRYLLSSMAAGFVFAGLLYRSWIRRVGFFLASAIVPVLANGFRVYAIVLLAYLSGNRIAAGVDHILYGWLFFTIVMFLLLSVGLSWREKAQKERYLLSSPAPNLKESYLKLAEETQAPVKRIARFAAIGILVIGFAPFAARFVWSRSGEVASLHLALPTASSPWHPTDDHLYGWKPSFLAPDAELLQSYESPPQTVRMYVAYYAPDRQDMKLVSSMNALFDRILWSRTGEGEATVTLEGQSFRVHETFIRSAEQSLVLWNWYWVEGTYTDNNVLAKLLLARARFLHRRHGSAAIVLASEDFSDRQRGVEVLKEFLNHISLQHSLRAGRD